MTENPTPASAAPADGGDGAVPAPAAPPPPRRGPGHRGQDIRDTVAEMAAKAHEISLEAGSKMASAMRDVIGAAAGISAFAIESARDLVNYMVRRGQMSQEEASKLIREVEEAHAARARAEPKKAAAPAKAVAGTSSAPAAKKPEAAKLTKAEPKVRAESKAAPKPAKAKAAPAKPVSRPAAKAPAKKAAVKKR